MKPLTRAQLKKLGIRTVGPAEHPTSAGGAPPDPVAQAAGKKRASADRHQGRDRAFDELCAAHGLPLPVHEFIFAPWRGGDPGCTHAWGEAGYACRCGARRRRWRFDYLWDGWLALEVQGGLFVGGRHARGAALLKEHEKLNAALLCDYRVLFCTPRDIESGAIFGVIAAALRNVEELS